MLDLVVLHQKPVCSVLNAFYLDDIPCLPLLDLGNLIDAPFTFLVVKR